MRKKLQKQSLANILQNRCSKKFCVFSREKKTVLLFLRTATLLRTQMFPVKSAKFLITPFFTEHLPWLLLKLNISMLQLPICYMLEQEISIGMRAMEKKLNILKLPLPIHHILK